MQNVINANELVNINSKLDQENKILLKQVKDQAAEINQLKANEDIDALTKIAELTEKNEKLKNDNRVLFRAAEQLKAEKIELNHELTNQACKNKSVDWQLMELDKIDNFLMSSMPGQLSRHPGGSYRAILPTIKNIVNSYNFLEDDCKAIKKVNQELTKELEFYKNVSDRLSNY